MLRREMIRDGEHPPNSQAARCVCAEGSARRNENSHVHEDEQESTQPSVSECLVFLQRNILYVNTTSGSVMLVL